MPTDNRQFLLHGDTIVLNKINMRTGKTVSGESVEFTVLSKIGEGGSSVCYEACCDSDGTHGRLKEFYPVDMPEKGVVFSIERGRRNQLTTLIYADSTTKAYQTAREDFKNAYCSLAKAQNLEFGAVLNNYIPPFELYEGIPCEGSEFKSIYVWTRHDKRIKPFDRYIADVRADLEKGKNFERHLFNILNSVLTLAKCVRALHTADLLHMDIKPANFGVALDENGSVDSSNISLFDVNTVYSANSGFTHTAGTVGFRAPEVAFGRGGSRSDIYSIGATLFNAIFVWDGGDGIYRDEYYQRLESLVSNAVILKSSDRNSNSALHDILVRIFKMSLAHHPDKRYKACSYLVDDLAKARAFLLPFEVKNALTELGKEIRIVNIEEHLDSDIKAGALGAVQRLLYEHPLYNFSQNGEIKVLVLGGGTYAQRFIDAAFAVAQNNGCRPSVTVVSDNIETDRDRYLCSRPAFSKFFTVDGILPEKISLGEIEFLPTFKGQKFSYSDRTLNLTLLKAIKQKVKGFSYCFIALGDDRLNGTVAENCRMCDGLLSDCCGVHFVQYKHTGEVENCHPVYVNDVISFSDEYDELKRMAFNCHCLWNGSLNIGIKKLRAEFMKPYNFSSSLSNVLSVKYKLHSVGIDDTVDKYEAARRFFEVLENDSETVDRLAMFEHRRWLVESVCNGWDTLTDYTTLGNDTRDRRKRLHPCVVSSKAGRVLNSKEWLSDDHKKWDNASDGELAQLDELDRVSVVMHRHFKAEAEKRLKVSNYKTDIEQIRFALRGHTKALKAFEQFVLCINGVADRRKRQVRLYAHYRDVFKKELKRLTPAVAQSVANNLEAVEDTFYPVLQSLKYTDYKMFDSTLVEGVPFILTHSTDICLVLPVEVPDVSYPSAQNKWFDLVSPIIAVDPKTVTFVVDAQSVNQTKALLNGLLYVVKTADIRNLQAKFNVLFLDCAHFCADSVQLKHDLKQMSQRFGNIEFLQDCSKNSLERYFADGKKPRIALRECDGSAFAKLKSARVLELLPKFRFCSDDKRFVTDKECDYLTYIDRGQCLKSDDMQNVKVTDTSDNGFCIDYEYFWNIFSRFADSKTKSNAWCFLCDALKQHTEKADTLFEFSVSDPNSTQEFFVPMHSSEKIESLLVHLGETVPSAICSYAFQPCSPSVLKLKISGNVGVIQGLKKLASVQHLLFGAQSARAVSDGKTVKVFGSSLAVKGFKLDSDSSERELADRALKTLEKLALDGYILNLESDTEGINFCFPSLSEKLMLTNSELVLGLSVCRGALESGRFDDVIGVFDTETHKSTREFPFDTILIKGFRSLIIECSVEGLCESVYEKLLNTHRNIGINATPVFVCANRNDNDNRLVEKYNTLGVVTVFADNDDVKNGAIFENLERLIEQ